MAALLAVAGLVALSACRRADLAATAALLVVLLAGRHRRAVLNACGGALLVTGVVAAGWLVAARWQDLPPPWAGALRLAARVAAMTALSVWAARRLDWFLLLRGHPTATALLVITLGQLRTLRRLREDLEAALTCRTPDRPGLSLALRHGGAAAATLLTRAQQRGEDLHQALVARGVFDADH